MNQVVKAIPVYTEANKEFFLVHPQLPVAIVDGYDTEVFTAPLLINKRFNLIGISMIESELAKGTQDQTMMIGDNVALTSIYLELGNNIIKVACPDETNIYQLRDTSAGYKPMELVFTAVTFLSSETRNTTGNPIDMPEEYKGIGEYITIVFRGLIDPATGIAEMVASLGLHNQKHDDVLCGRQEYFTSAKVVAFDLDYNLENTNSKPFSIFDPLATDKELREIAILSTIRYLEVVGSEQYAFLLKNVYRVNSAKEFIHWLAVKETAEIIAALQCAFGHDPSYDIADRITFNTKNPSSLYSIPVVTTMTSPLRKAYSEPGTYPSIPTPLDQFTIHLKTEDAGKVAMTVDQYNVIRVVIDGKDEYDLPGWFFEVDLKETVVDETPVTQTPDKAKLENGNQHLFKTKECTPFAVRDDNGRAVLMYARRDGYHDFTIDQWEDKCNGISINVARHLYDVCHFGTNGLSSEDKVFVYGGADAKNYEDIVKILTNAEVDRVAQLPK